MEHSESLKSFVVALNAFQSELDLVKRNAENPFFNSSYATYAQIWDTVQKLFTSHGFSIAHGSAPFEKGIGVVTLVTHISGEWMKTTVQLPLQKFDPQAVGSAISYGRRYNLTGLLGIALEDDDGNAASHREPIRQQYNQTKTLKGDL